MTRTLASLEAFAEFRGVDHDPTDLKALRTLEVVSSFIRSRTGQYISLVEDDVQELNGTSGRDLYLPQIPVSGVSSVSIRYRGESVFTDLAETAFLVGRDGQLTRLDGSWWAGAKVTVTYTHGYEASAPRLLDAENVCVQIAGRVLSNPTQVVSETLGPYSVTFADVTAAGLTAFESAVLDSLVNPNS